jgi:SET domain
VSQAEAQRRGQVYDKVDCSYLFQVNSHWAVDSRKVGGKMRCAAPRHFVALSWSFVAVQRPPSCFVNHAVPHGESDSDTASLASPGYDASRMWRRLCSFANHRNTNNAYAKVMLVNGEHRVAIYAKVPLAAGAEIFYDYGYHAASDAYCPKWGDGPPATRRGPAAAATGSTGAKAELQPRASVRALWGDASDDEAGVM